MSIVRPDASPTERAAEVGAAADQPGRVRGPAAGERAARARAGGGPAPQRNRRPRAAVGTARAGQDHPGDDHRRRDVGTAADLQRAGHPARRRPGRHLVGAGRGRGVLPRRDPPDVSSGRGDALPRDGGLPGRRGGRQGAGRDRDPDRDPAVHPGRRHHPGRTAARAAARPVRLHRPARLLRHGGAEHHPGRSARLLGVHLDPRAPPRSPAAPAAHRGSPTGCCAGSATSPRSGPTA